jgi:hypothetical protein
MKMYTGVASFLIERGADLTILNKDNRSVLDIAKKLRLDNVLEFIKRREQKR